MISTHIQGLYVKINGNDVIHSVVDITSTYIKKNVWIASSSLKIIGNFSRGHVICLGWYNANGNDKCHLRSGHCWADVPDTYSLALPWSTLKPPVKVAASEPSKTSISLGVWVNNLKKLPSWSPMDVYQKQETKLVLISWNFAVTQSSSCWLTEAQTSLDCTFYTICT